MPKQQYKGWCIGLLGLVILDANAHDKRCEPPFYGDSEEAVASYQADADNPIEILKEACEAKFSREKRAAFRAAGITDVQIEERYPADIATMYIEVLRTKLRDSAMAMSIVDFVLDGKQLAKGAQYLRLSGMYIQQSGVEYLYADTQAVLESTYSSTTTPPAIALLTEDASRSFRKLLLACQAHPTYSQVGCSVTLWGHATMCVRTNAFGTPREIPCIHVVDGE